MWVSIHSVYVTVKNYGGSAVDVDGLTVAIGENGVEVGYLPAGETKTFSLKTSGGLGVYNSPHVVTLRLDGEILQQKQF